jgi:surface antigen
MANFKYSPPRTHSSPYPTGQCTWLASTMKGNIPSWGNANQWDDNARASGKTVSPVPVVGSVAQTDRGYYGHVAIVVGVQGDTITITEGNYDYNGSIRTHTVPTSSYQYIYL